MPGKECSCDMEHLHLIGTGCCRFVTLQTVSKFGVYIPMIRKRALAVALKFRCGFWHQRVHGCAFTLTDASLIGKPSANPYMSAVTSYTKKSLK